jgi:two-component system, cell cycle response regulator
MTSAATVLVVDDSLVVRSVVRGWLEEHGYHVVEVEDGLAAVEHCLAEPPDVVLLDIEMPGLNGHQVLARLKSEPLVRDIPVVFLTNYASMDEVLRGLGGGAHDYLRKPFEPAELVARVGAAARVKKLQDELRRRNDELDRISRTDALTGLFNRRHLEEQLASHVGTARRHGHDLGVVLLDVDHFKNVNDTHGHPAGDSVLIEMSRRIRAKLRTEDIAGRWGGEEFLVIIPDTDLVGTLQAAERIRALVAAEPFDIADTAAYVTVSGGCSAFIGASVDDLVRAADKGLYDAKASGRNCVVPG